MNRLAIVTTIMGIVAAAILVLEGLWLYGLVWKLLAEKLVELWMK